MLFRSRLIVESLLGLRLEVDKLYFAPCLPADWKAFTMHYRYRETVYHIVVLQTPVAADARIGERGVAAPARAIIPPLSII